MSHRSSWSDLLETITAEMPVLSCNGHTDPRGRTYWKPAVMTDCPNTEGHTDPRGRTYWKLNIFSSKRKVRNVTPILVVGLIGNITSLMDLLVGRCHTDPRGRTYWKPQWRPPDIARCLSHTDPHGRTYWKHIQHLAVPNVNLWSHRSLWSDLLETLSVTCC